jgi:hypothetical protein
MAAVDVGGKEGLVTCQKPAPQPREIFSNEFCPMSLFA